MNVLRLPRVPLAAVLFVALAMVLFACRARADISTSTPLFTWAGAPAGTTSVKLYCDGSATKRRETNMPALTWQTVATDFTPGAHTCYAVAMAGTAVVATSSQAPFTIPPAAVVVPPPVPFRLTVQ